MKTDVNGLLKVVEEAVESLREDAGGAGFSPQLGAALGGLRAAAEGLKAHAAATAMEAKEATAA
jgi:hypothetical protein